ncbi:Predicted lipid carrier protein YhbT, contains SCP2 domain [Streptomyces sp. DvalAA-14]|uniref:SCP2 sterol-binding domain-containing protein n=1 Tax=unclassified Streptomyces TaxID=2593676 RepID=UPI00081B9A1D|nr:MULTISPECIES: SCP2 sterol-binding domain-containing protein [unclassified Streptomyces]MYS23879.1 sterol-binding protein [Streptomyces sp. SID4948]SCE39833.1 Predicted lipid carrier protein YhbT, contains SCP2 domain [Streptomyces sp. DvalAA-14]
MAAPDDLDLETLDFGGVEPKEFARIVKGLPAARLAEFMDGPQRRRVLDEVFGRMHTLFKPEAAGSRDALIRWRITHGDDGGDVYETHIAHGACTVTPERTDREPQLSLTMAAPEFLNLVSGNASGPTLFFTRKLKVKGDIRLAGGLTYFFDIPKP